MQLKHIHLQTLVTCLGITVISGCATSQAPCPTPTVTPAVVESPAPPAQTARPAQTGPLIVEGAPEVPADLREKMLQYLEARSAAVRDISDDGRTLLVATRFGSSDQLHIVSQPLGTRRQVTFGADSVKQAAFVPGRHDAFVFVRDTGGNENFQLYLADTTAGAATLLTDGKSRHGAFAFSRDGRRVAFTSNARNGRDMDVWVAPLADPNARKLAFERAGHWNVLGFSPDDSSLLLQEFRSIERSSLHLGNLANGTTQPLTSNFPEASFRTASFAPDGRSLWALSDADADFVGLWQADLTTDTPSWRPITKDIPWNIEDFAISPDGATVLFAANEDGLSTVRSYDVKRQRIAPGPALPDTIVAGLGFARKAPIMAFTASGSTRNGDAMTFDLRTNAVTRWTESEVGGLNPATFIAAETFRYDSFDGLKVPAFIYRPRGKGPHPVVINIHGGPESQSRPTFSALAQYLARESGIAVIFPNVRGSDGYGRRWLGLDNGRLREDSVRDIGALLDWVATQPDLDVSRVAVMGGSYGGYMVLASLVHFGERLRAGIDVVGISDFVTFLENTAEYRRHLRRAEYGDESDPEMRAFLKSISPLTHVDRLRSALFVAHGANDPRVPLSEALQVAEAVKAKGREVWTMVAMNEGHGFARRENRDMWLWLSVMFLEKHLRSE